MLSTTWKNLEPELNDSIEQEIIKSMQEEIDNEIIVSLYVQSGWKCHTLRRDQIDEGIEWCSNYAKNEWKKINSTFLFRDDNDYNWFILRW